MKGRRILFQDPDPRVLLRAERALAATGAEVELVQVGELRAAPLLSSAAASGGVRLAVAASAPPPPSVAGAAELQRKIDAGGYDLVMLNFDPPVRADPAWGALFDHLERHRPECRVALHATAPSEDYLPLLAERGFVRNLLVRNGEPLEPEELRVAAAKLLSGELFGVGKYLAWGATPLRLTVRDSRDKHALVAEAAAFCERLGVAARTARLVEGIADELITNAIYNAPRDAEGRPRYAALPRRQPVTLEPHEEAVLEIACDGNTLAVALSDPFGSLTQDTLVAYLNRCLVSRAPFTDETGAAGAGIGLYRVFQSLSTFVVNLEPGRRTEVIALIDLRVPMKKFRQVPKSFHIFEAPRAATQVTHG